MARALQQVVFISIFIMLACHFFPIDEPTSSSGLPWESAVTQIANSVRGLVPWLVGLAVFAFALTMAFGSEAGTGPVIELAKNEAAAPDLRALPRALRGVGEWLKSQSLPNRACQIGERISVQLETIAQLLKERERAEAAAIVGSLSKLLTEELPELIKRYQRVPRVLRLVPSVGSTATDLLISGLQIVDAQLQDIQRSLVDRSIQGLAVQTRFLALKYDRETAVPGTVDPDQK